MVEQLEIGKMGVRKGTHCQWYDAQSGINPMKKGELISDLFYKNHSPLSQDRTTVEPISKSDLPWHNQEF